MKQENIKLRNGQYCVYCHTVVINNEKSLYYIGITGEPLNKRWCESCYKTTSLNDYIVDIGWDNIKHTVLAIVNSKHEAETLEDEIIRALKLNGMAINKLNSGGNKRDKTERWHTEMLENKKIYYNEHHDEIREKQNTYWNNNRESLKIKRREQRSTPEWKIYSRVNNFNRYHPELAIETPLEAKKKYIESGYIPDYIKSDDIKKGAQQ